MAYHWVVDSDSGGFVGNFHTFRTLAVSIPAGGTVKRVIHKNTALQMFSSVVGATRVGPFNWEMHVTRTGGFGAREIFSTNRMVPFTLAAFHDVLTAERVYSAYWGGGDNEFGFNQGMSYGKASDVGDTNIDLESFVSCVPSELTVNPTAYFQHELHVLYHDLLP